MRKFSGILNYFCFEGRVSRSGFVICYLIPAILITELARSIFLPILLNADVSQYGNFKSFFMPGVLLQFFTCLLILIGVVKRLHDIGLSGWHFFFLIIPIINFVAIPYVLLCRGESKANKYGESTRPIFMLRIDYSEVKALREQKSLDAVYEKNSRIIVLTLGLVFFVACASFAWWFAKNTVLLNSESERFAVYYGDLYLGQTPMRISRAFFENKGMDFDSVSFGDVKLQDEFVIGDELNAEKTNVLRFEIPKSPDKSNLN
jgi:Predicted membrane protein